MEPLLKVTDLKVDLNSQNILKNIDFELFENETLAIIGPNGAGKTVLFRALLGLVPTTGTITWKKDLTIGYVPQKLFIEPDLPLTTAEFFRLKGAKLAEVKEALTGVGFSEDKPHKGHLKEHVLERKMGILSGGELQRVLIAWALLGGPEVLLFDEPTSGVDIGAEETIYSLLKKLQEKKKLAILLISHDLNVVYRFANKVICLNQKMVCFGPPRDVLDKESLAKLYGQEIGVYQHSATSHHEH